MHVLPPASGAERMPSLSELAAQLGARLVRPLNVLAAWRANARERAVLAEMDDRLLTDIGVSRAETWVEVEKPFWRS